MTVDVEFCRRGTAYRAPSMGYSRWRGESYRKTFSSSTTHLILMSFAAGYVRGAVAPKFGFTQHQGTLAAIFLVAFVNTGQLLAQELPRQGLPFLRRWLILWGWASGSLGMIWSATRIRYDQWAVLYFSLHDFAMIMLTVSSAWLIGGRLVATVVFGRTTKAGRKSPGDHDPWLD